MTGPQSMPRHPRRASHGFVLLEVLVALLIFAFGVLGIVGLQATMTKAQTSSKLRGEAASLAQELIGTMWADIPNLNQYTKPAGSGPCSGYDRCQAILSKVSTQLPQGAMVIEQAAPGVFNITVTWTPPGESSHQYVTSTVIQT